jgi:CO/xanthine dehydrogenase FAD-binding subunit
LRGITQNEQGMRIGAATRWSDIVRADLPACFDGLKQAAREVGSLQVQNAGTVAGNICNASPAADGVPPLLTLDAQVELTSKRGVRILPLGEFLTGVRQTLRASDELVTAILVPTAPAHGRGAFAKLGSRSYLVISITMTAAVIGLDHAGRIDVARVAVGACSAVAQRLPALEADLLGQLPADIAVSPHHLAPLSPISDVRGSAAFRLDVVAQQCLVTLRKAVQTHG